MTPSPIREQTRNITGAIRAIIEGEYRLIAYCHTCNKSAELDMRAMAERYGMDVPVKGPRLIGCGLLTCSGCGSANCSMRIHPHLPKFTPSR